MDQGWSGYHDEDELALAEMRQRRARRQRRVGGVLLLSMLGLPVLNLVLSREGSPGPAVALSELVPVTDNGSAPPDGFERYTAQVMAEIHRDRDIIFVDADLVSDGPGVVSVFAGPSEWGAATKTSRGCAVVLARASPSGDGRVSIVRSVAPDLHTCKGLLATRLRRVPRSV